MWREEYRVDPDLGVVYRPGSRPAGWREQRFHLGDNKVFDAKTYAARPSAF